MDHRKMADDLIALVRKVFPKIGQEAALKHMELQNPEPGLYDLYFTDLGTGVEVGFPITVRTVAGVRDEPGYRVYQACTSYGSSGDPDDVSFDDVYVSRSLQFVVRELAGHIVSEAVQRVLDTEAVY